MQSVGLWDEIVLTHRTRVEISCDAAGIPDVTTRCQGSHAHKKHFDRPRVFILTSERVFPRLPIGRRQPNAQRYWRA